MNPKSNKEHTIDRGKLYYFLIWTSIGASVTIMLSQIYFGNFHVFIVAFFLFVNYIISFLSYKYYNVKLAYHLYLIGNFIPYNLATLFFTTNLIAPILVYPLLLLLSFYYFDTRKEHIMYLLLCLVSEFYFVFGLNAGIDSIDYALIINGGFLIMYTVTTYLMSGIYLGKLRETNQDLIESKDFINKQNVELQRYIDKNMQLENFSYLASHELQTPLNNISNFSNLLAKKLQNQISSSDQELFKFISEGTENMQVLIKSMLKYNILSNDELTLSSFTPKVLLDELLYNFNDRIIAEKAIIEVKELPKTVIADKALFKQVVSNLITNALKFKSPDRTLVIKISGKEQNGFCEFSVSDNGLGINKEYFDRIFLMFKKLHNKEEYDGLGFGLAFSKKIIEKHNGRIWVDSIAGKGSTFHFKLPRNIMKKVA